MADQVHVFRVRSVKSCGQGTRHGYISGSEMKMVCGCRGRNTAERLLRMDAGFSAEFDLRDLNRFPGMTTKLEE